MFPPQTTIYATSYSTMGRLTASLRLAGSDSLLAVAIWPEPVPGRAADPSGPVTVELKQIDGCYVLLRGGQPYRIQGAGLEFGSIEKLAEHGGNSFRTWRTENGRQSGQEVLDRALENGLTVTMGLAVAAERHGFDYNDEEAVARQLERVKREVLKYKDHPALSDLGDRQRAESQCQEPARLERGERHFANDSRESILII